MEHLITRDWLDEVSDDQGLTKGQQELLGIWCKEAPFVGKQIPQFVVRFIGKCRGYRGMSAEVRALVQKY